MCEFKRVGRANSVRYRINPEVHINLHAFQSKGFRSNIRLIPGLILRELQLFITDVFLGWSYNPVLNVRA